MSLTNLVPRLLEVAAQLQSKNAGNEANTKHHLIEPVLRALGWDLDDFSEVDREFRVYDGTFLDYALRIDGSPKLFVEAKGLGKSLGDRQFIAQTVNYANNEGVVWCVLTNGLAYHVYKSNEPVPMERKLLFEIDLVEANEPEGSSGVLEAIQVLSRSSVKAGSLDAWGESVFVDMRTRSALSAIGKDPDDKFVALVSKAIDGPQVDSARLKVSLARVLGGMSVPSAGALVGAPPPATTPAMPAAVAGTGPATKSTYSLEYHTVGRPSAIVDLFGQIDSFAGALGDDVQRRFTKQYIGYFTSKRSFFTLELQKTKIYAYLAIPPADALPWHADEMRDVTKIGHYGMGDTEFVLRTPDQVPRLKPLIEKAYLANRR